MLVQSNVECQREKIKISSLSYQDRREKQRVVGREQGRGTKAGEMNLKGLLAVALFATLLVLTSGVLLAHSMDCM